MRSYDVFFEDGAYVYEPHEYPCECDGCADEHARHAREAREYIDDVIMCCPADCLGFGCAVCLGTISCGECERVKRLTGLPCILCSNTGRRVPTIEEAIEQREYDSL